MIYLAAAYRCNAYILFESHIDMKPANFREVRKYGGGSVDSGLIEQAASNLKMKLVKTSDTLIKIKISLSYWSFGETITISLGIVENCHIIDITSSCIWFTQNIDWGKNQKNVLLLFDEIDKLLGDEHKFELCLLCNGCEYLLIGIHTDTCPECGKLFSSSDKNVQRNSATFRDGAIDAMLITGVETGVCFLIDLFVGSGLFSLIFIVNYGIFGLLLLNICIVFAMIGISRIVKRNSTKRD